MNTLDKTTLHAVLATLTQNVTTLDAAIAEKTEALRKGTIDLERTIGARSYHDMVVQQVQLALKQIEAQEQTSITSAT